MKLGAYTSGQYRGRVKSLLSVDYSSLSFAFLEIRQTREMLELIKHADKGLYDRSGFAAITAELDNMLPDYRDATNHVIESAQRLLEQDGSAGARQQAAQIARNAAAHDSDLIDSYLLIMQDVNAKLVKAIDSIPPETDLRAVKSPPGTEKTQAFDWPHSAKVHANAAVHLLQKTVNEKAQASEVQRAAR